MIFISSVDPILQPITPEAGLRALQAHSTDFIDLFTHGSLVVAYDKPDRVDKQQPHAHAQICVITSGTGTFELAGRQMAVKPGKLLFVPAGVAHRFGPFTDDFATWVLLYGPDGGEKAYYRTAS